MRLTTVKLTKRRMIGLAAAAVVAAGVPIITTSAADAGQILTATTAVNVRSGPGTGYSVLGVVYWGGTIEATGADSGGWTPVTYSGRSAYVSSQYFKGAASGSNAGQQSTGPAGNATTTAALNVRSGPGTSYGRLTTLPYGASVSLTGVTDNGFLQIAYQGGTAWVSGSWVSQSSAAAPAPAPAAPPAAPAALPAVTGQRQTAADLNFRSGPGLNHGVIHVIPNGATIDVTGASQNGFLQIVRQNQAGWVSAQYVKDITAAAPTPAPVPAVTGQLFTTDYLNVRTQASSQGSVVTVLAKGSKVDITGATSGTWHQIIYQGAVRWVASAYLAATAPAADPVPAQTMTPAQAQANARQQVAARGWGDDQFRCLVELWNKESGWRMNAENPYSGAYGIPQALPGSKMASAGADWRTNAATQISWGLGYISQRYSTPCGAWGFFQSNNWY